MACKQQSALHDAVQAATYCSWKSTASQSNGPCPDLRPSLAVEPSRDVLQSRHPRLARNEAASKAPPAPRSFPKILPRGSRNPQRYS